MEYRIDFEGIPWEVPMRGVRYKAVRQGSRQLRMVEYAKEMEPHWCEKGHIGYVLEGQLEIRFEDALLTLNPGDGIFIPEGKEHKHMAKVLSSTVRAIFVEDM